MECIEITNQKIWEEFVLQHECNFLHSWEWGEFNISLGHSIERRALINKEKEIVCVFLAIIISAKRGRFLFIPHGPIFSNKSGLEDDVFKELLTHLKTITQTHACLFIRISPLLLKKQNTIVIFKHNGFVEAPMHMHSELCWVLDLAPSEDDLLKNMRKTTRYLIKQKEKSNITVNKSTDVADFDQFYSVYLKTQQRQQFVGFSKDYLYKEISTFLKSGRGILYFAYCEKVLLSTAFIVSYGNAGYYHHGASIIENKNTPTAYVIQWEIIKDLKTQGKSYYNFWGIAPQNNPKHPWNGLTFFKQGFGGESVEYIHAQDFKLHPLYYLNWGVETLRKIKRGY